MHVSTTLPPTVVGLLRRGAYLSLREPFEELDKSMIGHDEPGRFKIPIEPYWCLMRAFRLLDALGWSKGDALDESTIDFSEHGAALAVALDNALKETEGHLDHPDLQARAEIHRTALALCSFALVIDETDFHLAHSDPRVRAFHESGERLLAELEREGAEYP